MHILITGGAGFLGQRLARYLLKNAELQSLTLADITLPLVPDEDARVNSRQSDLSQPQAAKDLITSNITAVYHLAAVVSAQAEANFDLGMSVNCDGTRYLLEAARHQAPGAMFIFTSSLAVFGGDLPAVITDETTVRPQSSYGMQKAVSELWVNDYRRRGFIDGRVLRLPTVCVRPGKPNAAASSFASSIIREPLKGETAICPVDVSLPLWLTSPVTVTANLAHCMALPPDSVGYAVNLPGITITVQEMIDALGRVSDPQTLKKIQYQPDDNISKIVAGWPSQFNISRAEKLGFERDRTFDDMIRAFMTESL